MKLCFSSSSQDSGRAVGIKCNLSVVLQSCGVTNNDFEKHLGSQLSNENTLPRFVLKLGLSCFNKIGNYFGFKHIKTLQRHCATELLTVLSCEVEPGLCAWLPKRSVGRAQCKRSGWRCSLLQHSA